MGVSECDNMLMLLGVSNRLTKKQRDVVTPLVIKGFGGKSQAACTCENLSVSMLTTNYMYIIDLCSEAGTTCNGGQSVINPWYIIGGVASSVCKKSDFIM